MTWAVAHVWGIFLSTAAAAFLHNLRSLLAKLAKGNLAIYLQIKLSHLLAFQILF
jgi:hypothetical protein